MALDPNTAEEVAKSPCAGPRVHQQATYMVGTSMAGLLMGFHMPRTPDEFNNYVAKELRAGDKRMDEIVKTVAAIQIEQASAKVLAPTNTNTGNL